MLVMVWPEIREPPITYGTDAEAMRDELDYEDMVALSMYRRWILYDLRHLKQGCQPTTC
jgi:hypothetical protein